jgi:hypothetical protein
MCSMGHGVVGRIAIGVLALDAMPPLLRSDNFQVSEMENMFHSACLLSLPVHTAGKAISPQEGGVFRSEVAPQLGYGR